MQRVMKQFFFLFCFLFSLSKSKSFCVDASESWHMFNFLSKWPRNEEILAFSTPSNYCIWSIKAMENWTWQVEKPKSRLLTSMQTKSCRPKTKAHFKGQCILDAAQPWTTTVYTIFALPGSSGWQNSPTRTTQLKTRLDAAVAMRAGVAFLRVWDAMLCSVDAQTSKFSFSKGSRFFSLDPMKLTAKRKPIYCFFHAMNCIPFFFLMIFLWHDLKMWKSSLNHLRKKPKRSLYFPTCKCQIRQSSHPQWPCR